jgi:hypothetical protein
MPGSVHVGFEYTEAEILLIMEYGKWFGLRIIVGLLATPRGHTLIFFPDVTDISIYLQTGLGGGGSSLPSLTDLNYSVRNFCSLFSVHHKFQE